MKIFCALYESVFGCVQRYFVVAGMAGMLNSNSGTLSFFLSSFLSFSLSLSLSLFSCLC